MPDVCSGASSITAAVSLNQLLFSYTFITQKSIYPSVLVFFTSDLTFWLKGSDLIFEGSLTPNEAVWHSSLIYTKLLNTIIGRGQYI